MQHIPDEVKHRLSKIFTRLTDGKPENYHREYRPRVDGPPRWFLYKGGEVVAVVEVDWSPEGKLRHLSVCDYRTEGRRNGA